MDAEMCLKFDQRKIIRAIIIQRYIQHVVAHTNSTYVVSLMKTRPSQKSTQDMHERHIASAEPAKLTAKKAHQTEHSGTLAIVAGYVFLFFFWVFLRAINSIVKKVWGRCSVFISHIHVSRITANIFVLNLYQANVFF